MAVVDAVGIGDDPTFGRLPENLRQAADGNSNGENLLIIEGKPKLTAAFEDNFEKHLAHSKLYVGVKKE